MRRKRLDTSNIKMRMKKNRWKWNDDLTQKSVATFMCVYGIFCLVGMCLTLNESTSTPSTIATCIFAPFWYSCFLSRSFRDSLRTGSSFKTGRVVLIVIFGFFMLSAGGMGLVSIFNGLASPIEVSVAQGIVIDKARSSRYDARTLALKNGEQEISIKVSPKIYDRAQIGDYYISNYRLGGLGYYYRWRINSWNTWEQRTPLVLGSLRSRSNPSSER